MPYKSAAQRGYFHAHKAELEAQGVNVSEWDRASKGKSLPYHVAKKADGGEVDELPTAGAWAQQPLEEAFQPRGENPFNPGPQVPSYVQTPFGETRSLKGPYDQSFPGFGRPEDKSYGKIHDIVSDAEGKMRSFLGPGFNEAANKVSGLTSMLAPGSGELAAMEETTRAKEALEEGNTGQAALHGAGAGLNATLGSMPGGAMAGKLAMAAMGAKAALQKAPQAVSKYFDHGFLDTSNFQSLTGSKGTMEGGFKLDPTTGAEYYVKQAPSLEQAKNEKLTAELYKLFGVPVADVHLTEVNGKPGIASKKIEGDQLGNVNVPYGDVKGLHENYPVHAMLANHDAVGTGPENPLGNIIVDKTGQAHVIDTGGGLLYKGTGGKKPQFTPEVNEIHTMDNPDYSYLSAEAFGGRDPLVERVGAQRIANSDDKEIARLVELYGPSNQMEKLNLISTLLKRKHNIMEHYGVQPGAEIPKNQPDLKIVPKDNDIYEQKPFTEEEYQKWGEEIPPPLPDDVVAPRQNTAPLSQPFAKILGPIQTDVMMSGIKQDKKLLQTYAKDLADKSDSPWETAQHLWQIAQHVNPQTAEALFRNLPPKAQVEVGHRLAALRDKLDYSPFNSVAKGSAKDGKHPSEHNYYTTATHQYIPPNSILNDPMLEKYAGFIEGKKAPEKTATELAAAQLPAPKIAYEPIPMGYASPSINAPKEAYKLLETFKTGQGGFPEDYNIKGIGHELAKFANEYPSYADKIYDNFPSNLQGRILKEYNLAKKTAAAEVNALDVKKATSGKFDEKEGFEKFSYVRDNPVGIAWAARQLNPIKDWKNWKPAVSSYTKPAFPSEAKETTAKALGFNTNFEIHKGGEFWDIHPENPSYPKHIPSPHLKPTEPAWFGADQSYIASQYGKYTGGTYVARAKKAYEIDWKKVFPNDPHWSPTPMHNLIVAAKNQGADLLIVHGMSDAGGFNQTQYAVINPAILRGPAAKFNPAHLDKSWPLAGLVGGALFTYGQAKDDKMNRGGIPGLVNRAKKYAGGGAANPWSIGPQKHPRHPAGMIKSSIPGRTDKIAMSVPPGSYILPADIPSALGEGNTMAGAQILSKMFKIGPYGSGMTGKIEPSRIQMPRFNWMKPPRPWPKHFADGGNTEQTENEDIPIIAAGGEMVLHPEQVMQVGHGDLKAGHKVLDKFVLSVRKKHIETLRSLKPPKK